MSLSRAGEVIFQTNMEKMVAHNAEPEWTYTLAPNKFADMTAGEFKAHYSGYDKASLFAAASSDPQVLRSVPDVCGGPKAANATFDEFSIVDASRSAASLGKREGRGTPASLSSDFG